MVNAVRRTAAVTAASVFSGFMVKASFCGLRTKRETGTEVQGSGISSADDARVVYGTSMPASSRWRAAD